MIAANVSAMFPGSEVAATATFRITRDADVVLQDNEQIEDLLRAMEEVVLSRRRREPVRLTISARPDPRLKKWLADWLRLPDGQIYEVDGPQEASALWRSSTAGEWRSCGARTGSRRCRATWSGPAICGRPSKTTTCCCSIPTKASTRW